MKNVVIALTILLLFLTGCSTQSPSVVEDVSTTNEPSTSLLTTTPPTTIAPPSAEEKAVIVPDETFLDSLKYELVSRVSEDVSSVNVQYSEDSEGNWIYISYTVPALDALYENRWELSDDDHAVISTLKQRYLTGTMYQFARGFLDQAGFKEIGLETGLCDSERIRIIAINAEIIHDDLDTTDSLLEMVCNRINSEDEYAGHTLTTICSYSETKFIIDYYSDIIDTYFTVLYFDPDGVPDEKTLEAWNDLIEVLLLDESGLAYVKETLDTFQRGDMAIEFRLHCTDPDIVAAASMNGVLFFDAIDDKYN